MVASHDTRARSPDKRAPRITAEDTFLNKGAVDIVRRMARHGGGERAPRDGHGNVSNCAPPGGTAGTAAAVTGLPPRGSSGLAFRT